MISRFWFSRGELHLYFARLLLCFDFLLDGALMGVQCTVGHNPATSMEYDSY